MSLRGRGQGHVTHHRPECLKRPPARNKDASLLKGTSLKPLHTQTHTHMHALQPVPPAPTVGHWKPSVPER